MKIKELKLVKNFLNFKRCGLISIALFSLAVFISACAGGEGNNMGKISGENVFPSVLEEFVLEEFSEAFFENNTLILVPFEWHGMLNEYLDFYTVFAENGKLNFLIEVTHPTGFLDALVDRRIFAIVILNEILGKYEVGEMIVFETYDFSVVDWFGNPIEKNPREWLNAIQEKSVVHRVGVYPRYGEGFFYPYSQEVFLRPRQITVVDSVESLQECLVGNTAD